MARGNKEETETKKPADSMSQRALEFVAEKEGFEPSIPAKICNSLFLKHFQTTLLSKSYQYRVPDV